MQLRTLLLTSEGAAMKKLLVFVAALAASTHAFAAKPCEELKAEIAAKIEAKGVKAYTLAIVPNDQVGDQKVVGSCDGGTKKIVYARN
jgi:predicted lipoprotein with Yx(FWY)xxD motif